MSAAQNVMIGRHLNTKQPLFAAIFNTPRIRRKERECYTRSLELLEHVGFGDKLNAKSGSLSYGKKRLLEIARALMSRPKLLLIDELSIRLELALILAKTLFEALAGINKSGTHYSTC